MNKFAMVLLTATMTLASGAALAADGNGSANAAAAAGAVAPDAKDNIAPGGVDNSKINTGSKHKHSGTKHHKKLTADEVHKNTQCKEGKCPNINTKVGPGTNTKTDGTTH